MIRTRRLLVMFKRLLFVVILLRCSLIYGHEPHIKFEHLTSKDGFSHSWVICIYRDSYGYMWFGSGNDGINKYDGCHFAIYKNNPKETKSLSNNSIKLIYEDSKRNLWVGTEYELNKYNRDLNRFEHFIPSYQVYNQFVNGFCERDDGKFFVTILHNLVILDPENKSVSKLVKALHSILHCQNNKANLKCQII